MEDGPSASTRTDTIGLFERLGLALFAVTLLISIAAVKLSVGPVPIRLLALLAAGACIAAGSPTCFSVALGRLRHLVAVVTSIALLGIVVSMLAAAPPAAIFQQVVEIHVQTIVSAVISYALILRFGVRAVLGCFLAAFMLGALVAIGQAIGLDPAWQLRSTIGRLSGESALLLEAVGKRERAFGLSYSPVHFGTQACLALVALFFIRTARSDTARAQFDLTLVAGALALAALCAVTGNRSPLLGMIVFLGAYVTITRPRAALLVLPMAFIAAALLPVLLDSLSDAGLRVAQTGDGSSEGRPTLRAFGLYLLGERPIGYGLTFNSVDYWSAFSHQASGMNNPLAIRQHPVHNFYLNVLLKYGVLLVAVLPFILPRTRGQLWLWFAFIPYLIHAFFHNDGPMQSDFLIFFIIPAALHLLRTEHADSATGPRRTWRRAFDAPSTTRRG